MLSSMPRKSSQVILPSGFLVPLDCATANVVPTSRAAVTTPITTRGKAIVISFAALAVRARRPMALVSGLRSAGCAQSAAPACAGAASQALSPLSGRCRTRCVDGGRGRPAIDDAFGPRHFLRRTMGDHQELVRFDSRLVLHDAVPGDAEAGERRPEDGQASDDHGPLQRADQGGHEGTRQDNRTKARDEEEGGPKEQAPQPTPEGPDPAPGLHAISSVVVADHVRLGVVVLAHDGKLPHIEAPSLKGLYRLLRLVMG